MDTTLTVTLILIGLVIGLDLVATTRLIRSVDYTRRQKTLQLLLIWLLPMVGSILVVFVMTPVESKSEHITDSTAPDMAGISAALLPVADPFPSENSDTPGHGHF